MENPRRIPWSVRVVAYLVVGSGLLSILRSFLGVYTGQPVMGWAEAFIGPDRGWVDLLIGLFKINVGASLLEWSRFWRFVVLAWATCAFAARVVLWIAGFLLLPATATMRLGFEPLSLSWKYGYNSLEGVILGVVVIAFHLSGVGLLWWALDRPVVRQLYIQTK